MEAESRSQHCHCSDLRLYILQVRRVSPTPVLLDEVHQSLHGILRGDGLLHAVVLDVKIHLANAATNISKISVCHLTWPIHDAAHDGDSNTWQMARSLLDLGRRGLQVKERPAAGGAADELSLGDAHARSLEQVEGRLPQLICGELLRIPQEAFAHTIHKKAAEVCSGFDNNIILVLPVLLGVVKPQHRWNTRLALHDIDEKSPGKESPAVPDGRLQQQHSGRGLLQCSLHGLLRLFAGEKQRVAAQALRHLIASGRILSTHHDCGTLGDVRAGLAKHTCRHIQESLQLHTNVGCDHAIQDHHIHALPVLLHVAISSKTKAQAVAKSSGVEACKLLDGH
mmetsp:Transcript_107325/g.256315  ORF Transcript_107325/g.256315 Transcript_107325/m.256315 type:complete len:339 (-) Transcript_107325:1314-2330(-)